MTARSCLTCNTTFFSEYTGVYQCSACQQTQKLVEQAGFNRQLEAKRLELELLKTYQQKETAKAIERQTQAILETSIKPKEAYNKGFNYIENEFVSDNPLQLNLEISENGKINYWCKNEFYITPKLNENFNKGLEAKVGSLPNANFDLLKHQAQMAGREIGHGKLTANFKLHTGVYLNDTEILTGVFESNFQSTLNEDTGVLEMTYTFPFENQELNDSFAEGLNQSCQELNTPELIESRLNGELAQIRKEKQRQEQEVIDSAIREKKNMQDTYKMYYALGWIFPIVTVPIFWYLTYGFINFLLIFILVPWLTWFLFKASNDYKKKFNLL